MERLYELIITLKNYDGSLKFNSTFPSHIVATLALGSRPRQGLARGWAKRKPKNHISCSRECKREWGNKPSHSQRSSHFGSWSPHGFLNFHRAILGAKTQWIEDFLIPLETSWTIDVRNGLAWSIWTFETQVMTKRWAGSQIGNLTPNH
jgi:hypothetical protein